MEVGSPSASLRAPEIASQVPGAGRGLERMPSRRRDTHPTATRASGYRSVREEELS